MDNLRSSQSAPYLSVVRVSEIHQVFKLRFFLKVDRALAREVFLGERSGYTTSGRQRGFDLRFDGQIAAVGVAQKDQPHHRHEVFVAGVVAVGAKVVGAAP